MKKQTKKVNSILEVIGFCTLTVAGFIIIPSLLDKLSTRLYKQSLKNREINIDEMEPIIVQDNSKDKEEN